jgi:hypothetical protein
MHSKQFKLPFLIIIGDKGQMAHIWSNSEVMDHIIKYKHMLQIY